MSAAFRRARFTRHGVGEYVRRIVHTNTVESFYNVFKRGMKGIYQHRGTSATPLRCRV